MTVAGPLSVRHSPDFVAAWRSVFCSVYRWRQDGRFAMVPSLLGSPVFAYLPGLSYTDLNAAEAQELAREVKDRAFNIRVLGDPQPETDLPAGASAVLRIDLAAFDHDRELVWKRSLNRLVRRMVRRARKADFAASEETGSDAFEAFRAMLHLALVRHGAPMPPASLFEALVEEMGARILVVRNRADGRPLASLLWFRDGPLAWVPWSGGRRRADGPGHLLFWAMVEHALNDGADVVDFGRSRTGSGAYTFKRYYGATPVPVSWLSDKSTGLYRRYGAAQKLWRALPNPATDRVGPRLCRYLADY